MQTSSHQQASSPAALFEKTIPRDYRNSPMLRSLELGRVLNGNVYLKDETVSPIGSFKGRGAFHYFALCSRSEIHVVCGSAGNFGQGMAAAARHHDCTMTVFASENANPRKVAAMQTLGARVILTGRDFDEAKESARAFAAHHGFILVEDGAEDSITEGASSIGHEVLDADISFDQVILPLGNGALLSGVARAFKSRSPKTKMIGVVAEGAPAMANSWRARRVVSAPSHTIADGIAVRNPVPEIMDELYRVVDDVVQVSEVDLRKAMLMIFHYHGIMTEPAGVAGVAALLAHPEMFHGQTVVSALCGRNVSDELRQELYGGDI